MLINNVPLNGVKLLKCMDVLQYQQLTLKVLRAINIDFLLTISIFRHHSLRVKKTNETN